MSAEPATTKWTGWDPRSGKAAQPDAVEIFRQSATDAATTETRYELLAVAGRGFRPPQFMSTGKLDGETDQAVEIDEHEGLRATWSLLYRRVAETKPRTTRPAAIYLLGVNPPPDITTEEQQVFDDFYTNVHLPEVADRRGALRAERYELVRELRAPYQGAPRFLAAYEVDEQGAANRRHTGPPYASGPAVWQHHTTPWRLWYRLLGSSGDTAP